MESSRSAWGIACVSVVVLAMLWGAPAIVSAQDVASLTGVVTDPTGAVVADIDVKLVDTKTNTVYQTKTNSLGTYSFSNLKPGPGYQITFTREGFETLKLSDVYLAVNSAHTQNAQLKI